LQAYLCRAPFRVQAWACAGCARPRAPPPLPRPPALAGVGVLAEPELPRYDGLREALGPAGLPIDPMPVGLSDLKGPAAPQVLANQRVEGSRPSQRDKRASEKTKVADKVAEVCAGRGNDAEATEKGLREVGMMKRVASTLVDPKCEQPSVPSENYCREIGLRDLPVRLDFRASSAARFGSTSWSSSSNDICLTSWSSSSNICLDGNHTLGPTNTHTHTHRLHTSTGALSH
jgi:hypothetical protein